MQVQGENQSQGQGECHVHVQELLFVTEVSGPKVCILYYGSSETVKKHRCRYGQQDAKISSLETALERQREKAHGCRESDRSSILDILAASYR